MTEISPLKDQMESALRLKFSPQQIEVVDESDLHIGHAGHNGRGESHFSVHIVSSAFDGISRVERHRMVYSALGSFIQNGVHALKIKAFSPSER